MIPFECFLRPGGILQRNIVAIVEDLDFEALVLWHLTASTYDAVGTNSFLKYASECETRFEDDMALCSNCILRLGSLVNARVVAVAPGRYAGFRADEGNIVYERNPNSFNLAIMLPNAMRSMAGK